jgi:hypothetical protein
MVALDDVFKTDDFSNAVDGLASAFRADHKLPEIHQLGIVVSDVEMAAIKLEEKGIGPFFIASGSPVLWRERGEERNFEGKMGIAYHQGFELELLEPGKGSDFYRQALDPKGAMVVQHLGFLVPDVDTWAETLTASGYPLWIRGKLKSGPSTADFAYMDTVADAGLVIEFICWKLMGIRFNTPPFIFHTIGRIEKWSGKRSISL